MTAEALVLMSPLWIVGATVVVLLLAVAFHRSHAAAAWIALAGLALAFVAIFRAAAIPVRAVPPLLVMDDYALFYIGLILAATAAVVLLSYGYLEQQPGQREEYYMLLMLAALGSAVLVSAVHFASFFLGLELLSVSLYTLIAYPRTRAEAIEAGVKYLVLAAASAAFLLLGMAFVYAETGTMAFGATAMPAAGADRVIALVGLSLIVVGFGFKLALVPFHLWTPDVYQGAPAPVTAFLATVSKGAMFALLMRYLGATQPVAPAALWMAFAVIAVASMIGGNLLALLQSNVKRLLAYSSIAHLGYLIVAFLAGGPVAITAATFYLVAYFVTTLGAFGVVSVLSNGEREAEDLEEYRGLSTRRPWLAATLTAMLLSLAGIPLTAGFVGKFSVTVAAGSAALWWLLVVMMVMSGIGLFYYLRVIVVMYMDSRPGRPSLAPVRVAPGPAFTLTALTVALLWLGIYPGPLLSFISSRSRSVSSRTTYVVVRCDSTLRPATPAARIDQCS